MAMSELNRRRWRSFRRNGRAFWSLVIFSVLFVVAMLAEVVANDKPVVVSYRGELFFPAYNFYPETAFGGDFGTEAIYRDEAVQCLIVTGGRQECWDEPDSLIAAAIMSAIVKPFILGIIGEPGAHEILDFTDLALGVGLMGAALHGFALVLKDAVALKEDHDQII